MTYREYLLTPQWHRLRLRAFQIAGFKCESCNGTGLEGHHLTYERLFHERQEDIMALCSNCHQRAEAFISAGMLSRTGSVKRLREKTKFLLRPGNGEQGRTINTRSAAVHNPNRGVIFDLDRRRARFEKIRLEQAKIQKAQLAQQRRVKNALRKQRRGLRPKQIVPVMPLPEIRSWFAGR